MIYAHEIPNRSRLYFAKSAKIKRDIEYIASSIFDELGFEEIVTPFFSYHQHLEIEEKSLIRFNDEKNHILSMRADSTLDVVRLITKRLGRSVKQKRWFYIQPIFRYPSNEQYQIGAEYLQGADLFIAIDDCLKIIKKLNLKPILQISNIRIPQLISEHLDIPLRVFQSASLEEIFKLNLPWLNRLASVQNLTDLKAIEMEIPSFLVEEVEKIRIICSKIEYENIIVAPLYYSKMRYYDGLFFRLFLENRRFGMGGVYHYEDIEAVGFALYTDNLIEEMISHEQ
jgi:ATP phosphoribosyltransferase regulatory subunit HisZ